MSTVKWSESKIIRETQRAEYAEGRVRALLLELDTKDAALDAERADTAIHIETIASQKRAYAELACFVDGVKIQLTQLQALARALIYSDNAPEHDRAWFALRATLDATTPAPIDAAETHDRMFNHTDRHPEAL
jgi:hypothetical protein